MKLRWRWSADEYFKTAVWSFDTIFLKTQKNVQIEQYGSGEMNYLNCTLLIAYKQEVLKYFG